MSPRCPEPSKEKEIQGRHMVRVYIYIYIFIYLLIQYMNLQNRSEEVSKCVYIICVYML